MALKILICYVLCLAITLDWKVQCNRFTREELGVSDRLRFTSGKNQYYDCEVVNNRLVSNLKIGIYVYDHKSSINYYINDTNYVVKTEKLEDFYFAHITVKNRVDLNSNQRIKLIAKDNSDFLIDETVLNVAGTRRKINSAPTFLNSSSTVIVLRENVVVGSSVGKFVVINQLVPVTFYLEKKDFENIKEFTISVDGRLILTKQLDSTRTKKYNFPVFARYTESLKASSINVRIIVKPSLKLTEHRPIGTIGTLRDLYKLADDGRAARTRQSKHKVMEFSFSELSPASTIIGSVAEPEADLLYAIIYGNEDKIFQLNSKTGVISIGASSKLDYERTKMYKLSITGSYLGVTTLSVDVTLNVLDANDNSPLFSQTPYSQTVNVDEDTEVGNTILKLRATDKDSGDNGKVSFVLSIDVPVPFSVSPEGSLIVTKTLNAIQNSDSYYLYVKVMDSGSPFRRETEGLVKVNIIKLNTHEPVLRRSYCDISVPLSSKEGTVILKLEALDEDLDNQLKYRLETENVLFSLNSQSGELKFAGDLTDVSSGKSHNLKVSVSDGKHDSTITTLLITFKNDVNGIVENCENNKEYFLVKGLIDSRVNIVPTEKPVVTPKTLVALQFVKTPLKYLEISEADPLNTTIGVFNALNPNLQSYGVSLYTIASGNEESKFQIDLFNGTLYLRETLDREVTSSYQLEIRANGISGEPYARFILQITVTDVNDNAPVFTKENYKVSISEHKNIGYVLVKVQATDKDLELQQRALRYSLVSPSTIFKMNPSTGELTLESLLSEQPFKEYFVQIQASDESPGHPLYGYAWVNIVVSEFANNPPICLSDEQKIEVATNTPGGVTIGRVFAYDVNDGNAGKLTYSIKTRNNIHFDDYFSLNSETGLIQLKKQLSQQDKGVIFKIQVEIRDGGTPSKSTICHVYKIIVDGFGSSQPNFVDQSTPITASISYDAGSGALVKKLQALLPGNETSQNIKYELVDGNGIGIFTIDKLLGTIYVADSSFTSPFYWLTVQAYLASNPQRYRNAHVLVRIQHKKTRLPYFSPSVYHVNLDYSEDAERSIVQLYATDGDRRYNVRGFKYTIFAGNDKGLFGINENGLIKSRSVLKMGQYRLNVTVASASNNSLLSYGDVLVTVKNDHSNPPKFEFESIEVTIYETPVDGFRPPYLFQALARNPNPDELLTYRLVESAGSPGIHYTVNGETGVVDTKGRLQSGALDFVEVEATNLQQQSSKAVYMITVVSSPDKEASIAFKKKTYYADIREDSVIGTAVIDFKGEITDTQNLVHFYILSGNDQQNFYFSPWTQSSQSSLKIWRPLDFERQSSHSLEILAFNGRAYAKTKLMISVDNINDNSLVASQACFEARIPENKRSVDKLISVQVTDPDKRLPGFKYLLVNDAENTSPFTVNNDGVVSVKPGKEFDRETKDEYVITVVGGQSQENATYCVNVFIEDTNDHQPNFTQSVYQHDVFDSTPVGSFIMAAYATDKDTGSNARLSYTFVEENDYFGIDQQSGIVFVKNNLNSIGNKTVVLDTIASDHGSPPKSSRTQIKISLIQDLQRLAFVQPLYVFNISENMPAKSLVSDKVKLNMSTVHYKLVGNEKENGCFNNFWVDPFTGIILTANVLDHEEYSECRFKINGILYNTVVTTAEIHINVEDINDNRPFFANSSYSGAVSESQNSNTKVMTSTNGPLVVMATDKDSGSNGDIVYTFVEKTIGIYFNINEKTGEIVTNTVLDCEKHPSQFEFHVKATDHGTPLALSSITPVTINVINMNDRIPEFVDIHVYALSLPTYPGMIVDRLKAVDDDVVSQTLKYHLDDQNGVFDIKSDTGEIFVADPSSIRSQRMMMVQATVSDSEFSSSVMVQIKLSKYKEDATFRFASQTFVSSVVENKTVEEAVLVVNPIGYQVGEQLRFRILNPTPEFEIGKLSGIITVPQGVIFDREKQAFHILHIEAWRMRSPQNVARAMVNVSIEDINDNPPVFQNKKFYKAINIDSNVGTPLLEVKATDVDYGKNAIINYQITGGDCMEFFSCHRDTGVITLRKKIVKSQGIDKCTIEVRASDTKGLKDYITVELGIINKDQPMFSSNYMQSIPEDAPQGQSIVKISAHGRNNRQVYYQIVEGDEYETFHVGYTNGELTVAGELDYSKQRHYHMKIRAIDSLTGSWSDAICDISIIDVNNNYPMFMEPSHTVVVLEDTNIGSTILTVSAVDKDSGSNAEVMYSLTFIGEESFDLFKIGLSTGEISLVSPLDAEKKTTHLLQITASDNGRPSKSSYTYVTVNVGDVNDNKPVFLESRYDFNFESYHSESQFVGQVQAYDPDVKDVLTFYVAPKSKYVSVEPSTGTVYLKADPSPQDVINVMVTAFDGEHKATVEVFIHWKGGNEHTPRLENNYTTLVKENGDAEVKFLTKLVADDGDKGKYGKIKYQIDSDDLKSKFTIDEDGNIRTTGVIFDHEVHSSYVIPVRATDGGGRFDLSRVLVTVKDENDNSPVFEFSSYETYVKATQFSAVLVNAFAHDLDGGINSELKYVAHGLGSETPLMVDNKTGIISLAGNPRGNKYQFSIQVSDNGYPVKQSRADIKILVKGWNQNILTFRNSRYVVDVFENSTTNSSLLTVKAHLDGYRGNVTYKIINGNLPHTRGTGLFEIDPDKGVIALVGELDYESIKSYKLMINAETTHGESANCFVVVNVLNVNDNLPTFLTKQYSISVAENTPKGTKLIQLVGIDRDDPSGNSLAYSFSSKSPYFAINKRTGRVRLKKTLDREKQDSYNLVVRVKDGRSTAKSALSITVIDVNDSPPRFTKNEYSFSINEDVLMRQPIGTVEAKDDDLNSTLQYFFNSTGLYNSQFFIDHKSGDISLLKPIKAGLHQFSVVAYDGFHSTPTKVTVRVADVNDHSPVCINSYYSLPIKEDWDIANSIVVVKASDEDTADSLKYAVQGDGVGKFKIDEKTGALSAVDRLDYESQSRHNFKVVVTDNAGHNCGSDVFMQLIDVNDNTPKFNQDLYVATVHENTTQNIVVTQVRATDQDTLRNRKLTYSIIANNINGAFAIGKRGLVTVRDPSVINRKNTPKYTLEIQAKDDGVPPLSSKTKLQVIVLSNTDTPPQFDKLGYSFNITENNEPNAVLGQIIVRSTKNLIDKKIIVTVINDVSNNFFVDGNNYLKVKSKLDYETEVSYSFNIRAYYEVIPSLSSLVNVEIQVNDQNDHKPLFSQQGVFREKTDENVRPGTFVLQAFAVDKDGSNQNNVVTYSIEGDPDLPFNIGTQSGVVVVDGAIDHEIRSSYTFDIVATDNGLPPYKTKVKAIVNITDLNDNAPIISNYNDSAIVYEGKEPGTTLLSLTIHDVDSVKNGAPFECTLFEDDADMFEVVDQMTKDTCSIKAKRPFDRNVQSEFTLKLRATDSGTPKQFSTSQVKITVVKDSFHPPTIQDPKMFFVIVSRPYGVTKIGQVKIFDKDVENLHQFKIKDGNSENFFSIQTKSGVIEGRPTEGSYALTIEVTDGKFTDTGVFKVVVNEFNEEVKVKSISLLLSGVGLKTFMESKVVQFVSLLAQLSGTTSEKVFVWSIQDLSNPANIARVKRDAGQQKPTLRVALAVRRSHDSDYVEPSVLKGYVENSRNGFVSLGFDVSVGGTDCIEKKCPEKQTCVITLSPTEEIASLYVPSGYMKYKQEEKCYCPDGTEGPVCHDTNQCSHNPCKIGERCVVTSTYFKCECIEPNKCDLTVDTVTLTGESFIGYQLKKSFDVLFTTLSIQFRTETKSRDVLLYAHGVDFFYIEIEKSGHIMSSFDFGSGPRSLVIEGRKVNDGNWHIIHIERYGNFVSMTLDGKDNLRVQGRAPGSSAKININGDGIIFGARLSQDGESFSGFKGCMKAPVLNKKVLPFSGTNDMVSSVETKNVQSDCKDSGRCSVNKCPRFSECVNTLSSFECKCLPGHYGEECRSKLTCKDKPCKNGGLCTYEQVNGVVSYKCTCMQGFTGGQCQISLGPCASKPCRNNGKCIIVNENTYTCKCLVGFSGSKCSINDNPCASNPCRNGGTCRNLYNNYRCDCPPGHHGKQCSAGDYCTLDPCKNGGTCIEEADSARCQCNSKYFGRYCERDVDECLVVNTCPASTCINTIGDYYCNCTDGSKRKVCVIAAVAGDEKTIPLLFMIVGCVGALVLVLIIVVVVWCLWKKRKREYVQSNQEENEPRTKYPLDRYARGDEFDAFLPPSPPPRGEILPPGYYDENEQASAAGYDPSMVTFSSCSSPDPCTKVPLKFSPTAHTSIEYNSEEDDMKSQPGYHWDYSEVPEDIIIKQMSREGSRIQLTKADQYYADEEEDLQYVEMPEVPERPASRRSSLPGYAESDLEVPELPELPQQVRLSRQSLRSGNQSPTSVPRGVNLMASSDFRHRYSLLSDETDPDPQGSSYLHDDLEAETMSELTRVTRPRVPYHAGSPRSRFESESSNDDDGYTETSFNSDDNGKRTNRYDQDNPRELERHIQRLFKDLERRTKEDYKE